MSDEIQKRESKATSQLKVNQMHESRDSPRLDAMLASEEALVPSSGFLAAVMERVDEVARMPEPIPFPWKRALPGFVLATAAAGWGAVEFVRSGIPAIKSGMQTELPAPAVHLPALHAALSGSSPIGQAGWVAMALGVSAASWLLARLLVGRSQAL
jgi:hypothetical protein